MKYLDSIPAEAALYLEDPMRAPVNGWKPDDLMAATEAFFELREVYTNTGGGGMARPGGRNRATWANDRKQMGTPLGLRAPPDSLGGAGGGGGGGNTCGKCKGSSHGHEKCPNVTAAQDASWAKKPEAARKKPCLLCGGEFDSTFL